LSIQNVIKLSLYIGYSFKYARTRWVTRWEVGL